MTLKTKNQLFGSIFFVFSELVLAFDHKFFLNLFRFLSSRFMINPKNITLTKKNLKDEQK